jgi:hypothetical protein
MNTKGLIRMTQMMFHEENNTSVQAPENKAVLKIVQDETPQNPREEWDNFGRMICWHRRYNLGDKHYYADVREFLEDVAYDALQETDMHKYSDEQLLRIIQRHTVILPLYLYDHSGITMNTTGFDCPWDSGQVGFIYVPRQDIMKEYDKKYLTKSLRARVEARLKAEVEVYDQYLRGDVYGFILEDENGETIDSCWGFYGSDPKTNGMSDCIPDEYKYTLDEPVYE